jgi:hypothetical protein
MARFPIGRPVETREPVVTVDAGLEAGVHRFQLVVATTDGRLSRPDVVAVTVAGRTRTPTDIVIPRE